MSRWTRRRRIDQAKNRPKKTPKHINQSRADKKRIARLKMIEEAKKQEGKAA